LEAIANRVDKRLVWVALEEMAEDWDIDGQGYTQEMRMVLYCIECRSVIQFIKRNRG
jgi:hypothetical protein